MSATPELRPHGGMLAPARDADADDFWAALDAGVLLVWVCGSCGKRWLPPLTTCPRCGSSEVGSEGAPATAHLYSWSVIHLAVDPVFAAETPYTIGLVQLADGARLYGRIVGVEHNALRDGLELQVAVTRVQDQPIWYFTRPAAP